MHHNQPPENQKEKEKKNLEITHYIEGNNLSNQRFLFWDLGGHKMVELYMFKVLKKSTVNPEFCIQ